VAAVGEGIQIGAQQVERVGNLLKGFLGGGALPVGLVERGAGGVEPAAVIGLRTADRLLGCRKNLPGFGSKPGRFFSVRRSARR